MQKTNDNILDLKDEKKEQECSDEDKTIANMMGAHKMILPSNNNGAKLININDM